MQTKEAKSTGKRGIRAALGIGLGTVAGACLALFLRLAALVARSATRRRARPGERTEASEARETLRPGWSRPLPAQQVPPTYWPMVTALGIAFGLWGVISSLIISAIGLCIFVLGVANWIAELRHDQ